MLSEDGILGTGYWHDRLLVSIDLCCRYPIICESCVNGFVPSCPYFVFGVVALLDDMFTSEDPD
jgi:hypothetical protein